MSAGQGWAPHSGSRSWHPKHPPPAAQESVPATVIDSKIGLHLEYFIGHSEATLKDPTSCIFVGVQSNPEQRSAVSAWQSSAGCQPQTAPISAWACQKCKAMQDGVSSTPTHIGQPQLLTSGPSPPLIAADSPCGALFAKTSSINTSVTTSVQSSKTTDGWQPSPCFGRIEGTDMFAFTHFFANASKERKRTLLASRPCVCPFVWPQSDLHVLDPVSPTLDPSKPRPLPSGGV